MAADLCNPDLSSTPSSNIPINITVGTPVNIPIILNLAASGIKPPFEAEVFLNTFPNTTGLPPGLSYNNIIDPPVFPTVPYDPPYGRFLWVSTIFPITDPNGSATNNLTANTTIIGTPTTAGTFMATIIFYGSDVPTPPILLCALTFTFFVTAAPLKKKKKKLFSYPIVCCHPQQFNNGECPPKINFKGFDYERIEDSYCFRLVPRR